MQKAACISLVTLLLTGCDDTRMAIEQMNHQTSEARASAAREMATRLKANPNISSLGDIQLFLSSDLIAQALTLLTGFSVQLPERPDVTVKLISAAPELSEGVAAISLNLQATRGNLKVDVKGVATLLPEFTLRRAEPMKFKLVVERLAPHASWGPFSADIKGFVADFAQLKINDELNKKLPPIEVPMDNILKVDQPIQQREFPLKDGAYVAGLSTPAVSWAVTFGLKEVIVLPRGIHLIGDFSNPGSAQ